MTYFTGNSYEAPESTGNSFIDAYVLGYNAAKVYLDEVISDERQKKWATERDRDEYKKKVGELEAEIETLKSKKHKNGRKNA